MCVYGAEKRDEEEYKMGNVVLLIWKSGSLEIKSVAPFLFALSRFTKLVSGYRSRKGVVL